MTPSRPVEYSHRQSALVAHALAEFGVRSPATGAPYREALLAGLGGGIGFMYAVFSYRDLPPICTLVLRYHPHDFVLGMLQRAGIGHVVEHTSSARKAHRQLVSATESGSLCLATIGIGPSATEDVVVSDADDQTVVFSRHPGHTETVTAEVFAAMRASNRTSRHRLIVIEDGTQPSKDWALGDAAHDAIAATHTVLTGPVLGHAFDVNFGLTGMDRFASALADTRTKSGWTRVFGTSTEHLVGGLRRIERCVQHEFSAWGGMRPLYADFLDQVADDPQVRSGGRARSLVEASIAYRSLGDEWAALAAKAEVAADRFEAEMIHEGTDPLAQSGGREKVSETLIDLAHQMSRMYSLESAAATLLKA